MNPFTAFLKQWLKNDDLSEFIAYWDRLEAVVVRVYRQKMTLDEAKPEFAQVWPWLRNHYGAWEKGLRPFWQATKAGGQTTATDPFQLLLNLQTVEEIVGHWAAMQHLPAAREALNQYVLAHSPQETLSTQNER